MKILFIDGITGNYNADSLQKSSKIGGTEIAIMQTAKLLARQYQVTLAQKFSEINNVLEHYQIISYQQALNLANPPDIIIVIRPRRDVVTFAKRYPNSKIFYWMHDIPGKRLWKYKRKFAKYDCNIIAISNFQKKLIEQTWQGTGWRKYVDKMLPFKNPEIQVIYNPLANQLKQDETKINLNKLLFLSAPDRGLLQIINNFIFIQKNIPELKLFVAHPGYADLTPYREYLQHPKIHILGALPHQQIIQHLRESLCVFYPQSQKPECFGLIYAEANAVGTPVLAHHFGAANEILSSTDQLIDANDQQAILQRILLWQVQRPKVQLRAELHVDHILQQWSKILER